ncbi:MAG TPA: hypothetical protein DIC52_04275 [Candidatus Latescibacteria bacterium]|nr:hypothetical protein [Candidatus Latescibacterota bacterium]
MAHGVTFIGQTTCRTQFLDRPHQQFASALVFGLQIEVGEATIALALGIGWFLDLNRPGAAPAFDLSQQLGQTTAFHRQK